jgi:hypothetical protein
MPSVVVFGISFGFPELSRSEGQIAHVLLTRSPLVYSRRSLTARLACVKHAASVRPEPGSNSPLKSLHACSSEDSRTLNQWSIPARGSPLPVKNQTRKDPKLMVRGDVVLPKEPSNSRPASEAGRLSIDGALINSSSTFGTLLSSQGSCAHRCQASRPGRRGNSH